MKNQDPTIKLTEGYELRLIPGPHPYLWIGPGGDGRHVICSANKARVRRWLCKAVEAAIPGARVIIDEDA